MLDHHYHHGVNIGQGAMVVMHWGTVNVDPLAIENPTTFDLDDARRGLLTFDNGPRLCPNWNTARLVGGIALRHLATALPDLTLVGDPVRRESSTAAQLDMCQVGTS